MTLIRYIGELLGLFLQTLQALPQLWRQRRKVVVQMVEIGASSLLMAGIFSFSIGGVLALQTGPVFADRGLSSFLGGMVGLAMCRELAPLLMAILVAGRIGSAMAAELGSMRVYQELDALKTMNINVIHYLVLPRVFAVALALPMLVLFSNLIGWMGGGLVSYWNPHINVSWQMYYSNLRSVVEWQDILSGLIKSLGFAFAIGLVSCLHGLNATGGPRGIGQTVTRAVVNSLLIILLLDYVLTRILLQFDL